jgi:hypothetical protein
MRSMLMKFITQLIPFVVAAIINSTKLGYLQLSDLVKTDIRLVKMDIHLVKTDIHLVKTDIMEGKGL